MIKTICDECHSDFEEMDEYTSSQGAAIEVTITSGRRGHALPEEYHFDDIDCAVSWLIALKQTNPEFIHRR